MDEGAEDCNIEGKRFKKQQSMARNLYAGTQ